MDDLINMTSDPRFPIGKFDPDAFSVRQANIEIIAGLPKELEVSVSGLNDDQLDTPYREGGWTLRQTVHHIADSHINSLCRFKLALTEDTPTIRPYHEELWAELADSMLSLDSSLHIIKGVHIRWTTLLSQMSDSQFARELIHPDSGRFTLDAMLRLYAWHSKHHLAHITTTRRKHGW